MDPSIINAGTSQEDSRKHVPVVVSYSRTATWDWVNATLTEAAATAPEHMSIHSCGILPVPYELFKGSRVSVPSIGSKAEATRAGCWVHCPHASRSWPDASRQHRIGIIASSAICHRKRRPSSSWRCFTTSCTVRRACCAVKLATDHNLMLPPVNRTAWVAGCRCWTVIMRGSGTQSKKRTSETGPSRRLKGNVVAIQLPAQIHRGQFDEIWIWILGLWGVSWLRKAVEH